MAWRDDRAFWYVHYVPTMCPLPIGNRSGNGALLWMWCYGVLVNDRTTSWNIGLGCPYQDPHDTTSIWQALKWKLRFVCLVGWFGGSVMLAHCYLEVFMMWHQWFQNPLFAIQCPFMPNLLMWRVFIFFIPPLAASSRLPLRGWGAGSNWTSATILQSLLVLQYLQASAYLFPPGKPNQGLPPKRRSRGSSFPFGGLYILYQQHNFTKTSRKTYPHGRWPAFRARIWTAAVRWLAYIWPRWLQYWKMSKMVLIAIMREKNTVC